MSEIIQNLLTETFPPDQAALLEWLAEQVDDRLLGEIARADYGSDYSEHFKILKAIRDELAIPAPLRWIPKEVLELTRWSEPENPALKSSLTSIEGHLNRAFSCTVLLIAGGDQQSADYIDGENQTLIQLVASVLVLGEEAPRLTLQMLVWRLFSTTTLVVEDRPFFALAILLLIIALNNVPLKKVKTKAKVKERVLLIDGAKLKLLAEWVMEEEAQVRKEAGRYYSTGLTNRWLFDLTFFNLREDKWVELGRQLLLDPPNPHPPEADESLRLIGSALVGS